jgi:hypothetical protein
MRVTPIKTPLLEMIHSTFTCQQDNQIHFVSDKKITQSLALLNELSLSFAILLGHINIYIENEHICSKQMKTCMGCIFAWYIPGREHIDYN